MKTIYQLVFLLLLPIISFSQENVKETFYKDPYLHKKKSKKKAKFKEVVEIRGDTTITKRIRLKDNNVYYYKAYADGEPVGLWFKDFANSKREEIDYRFKLTYDNLCKDSKDAMDATSAMTVNNSTGYTPPVIRGKDQNLRKVAQRMFDIPSDYARQGKNESTTMLNFVINNDGTIGDISIANASNSKLIDKEAVRTISKLQFAEPPKLNGEPVSICVTMPIVVMVR